MVQQKTIREVEIEIEKFIIHSSWGKYMVNQEATPRGEGKVQAKKESGPRHMSLLESVGRVLWGSQTKIGQFKPKRMRFL